VRGGKPSKTLRTVGLKKRGHRGERTYLKLVEEVQRRGFFCTKSP